jgi:hypothetical protein
LTFTLSSLAQVKLEAPSAADMANGERRVRRPLLPEAGVSGL